MAKAREVSIRVPVLARVEGEGALEIDIADGVISNLKLKIFEPPRLFEKFLEGRPYSELPDTVARICGICPVAYQMSAVHAVESIFNVEPGPWVRKMRRLLYCGEWLESHLLHIHMLALPDFLGFNSVTEMAADHAGVVERGLRLHSLGNELVRFLGKRSVHPVGVRVGGFYHAPDQAEAAALLEKLKPAVDEAEALLRWLATLPLPESSQKFTSVAMRHDDEYPLNEGRLISSDGLDIAIDAFDEHFKESQVPYSTALHCRLDGAPYLVGPLARINLNCDRLPEPVLSLLNEIALRGDNTFHSIIARAAECYAALQEAVQILAEYRPDQPYVDVEPRAGIGYGCTEAPRGTLWHRYELDERGDVVNARIVPPTSQNQARIEADLHQALQSYGLDHSDAELQLHAETVVRNYDPCISCSTHFLDLRVQRR